MLKKITALLTVFLLVGLVALQAQTKPNVVITGEETPDMNGIEIVETSGTHVFGPVQNSQLTWDVHNITDAKTGYDLQSNGSTQQVWVDLNNPDFLHAVFTNSQESVTWGDRTCLYFGSTDAGVSWFELGPVPNTTRCGFPAVYGDANGSAVITNHNAVFTTTIATVMIDNSPFEYNFTNYDPSPQPVDGAAIWPRHTVSNGKVIMAASQNGPDSFFVNVLDPSVPSFLGYLGIDGEQAEQYAFAVSDGGIVGLAYNGQPTNSQDGDVYYIESTDDGMTWSPPTLVWARDHGSDTTMGAIRGVALNFYEENPVVAWETCQQIFSAGNFFPGLPSNIMLWGPHINGGVAVIAADSNNVPYAPILGTNDVMVPICRPVLGRSQMHDYLFMAFTVATEDVYPSPDTTSYTAGYFMYSMDGGITWSDPEKFTPDGPPIMDWRYPSIVDVSPTNPLDDDAITVHIVVQGDTIPGSTVNTAGMPVGVTAQYYHFSTEITVQTGDVEPGVVSNFSLEQNYPNPFNPSTQINYTVAEKSNVTLKVFDVLGTEVATLVNSNQDAGVYDVNFDASSLASGMYIYTLKAGNFTSSKKMMLLK